ncbi:hypothetical protein [Lentzea sp. NEAU-D7]|uniref:hypothetical protein n=1 Tax=Lentzea sp. NEAU-D7 TaxID=2994667 RepID=UPI00224AC921|nr:hypothetical protein [Lentzea sp. NEAU-D7]MCX2953808.1 hypothetical protein [Lentzea sp. NEAU-D7]
MSPREIRQLGVVLVAAAPGMALAAFVSAMTLPLYDFVRPWFVAWGLLVTLGCAAVGVVVVQVPDLTRLAKAFRFSLFIPVVTGFIALETLYTDYPEVDGLLTSPSSIAFTVAVIASLAGLSYVGVQVDRTAKHDQRGGPALETFIP